MLGMRRAAGERQTTPPLIFRVGFLAQASLNASRILLFGAGPTGSESLKNLVLPGVGAVTVVDPHVVTEQDLGNNFFLTADSLGKPRAQVRLRARGAASARINTLILMLFTCVLCILGDAQVVQELLCEMNDDVRGAHIVADLAGVLAEDARMLVGHTMVIATQLNTQDARRLAAACEAKSIPLIVRR